MSNNLVVGVFTGGLLVAVALATVRARAWRQYTPEVVPTEGSVFRWLRTDPMAWTLGFLALVVAALGGSVAYLSGAVGTGTVFLLLGALLTGNVLLGVYYTARSNGHPQSHAVAESAVALGALFVAVIAIQLVAA